MSALKALDAIGAIAAASRVLTATPAQADPPAAAFNTARYMPDPYNGDPLIATREVRGGYGLSRQFSSTCGCYPATSGSGF